MFEPSSHIFDRSRPFFGRFCSNSHEEVLGASHERVRGQILEKCESATRFGQKSLKKAKFFIFQARDLKFAA